MAHRYPFWRNNDESDQGLELKFDLREAFKKKEKKSMKFFILGSDPPPPLKLDHFWGTF